MAHPGNHDGWESAGDGQPHPFFPNRHLVPRDPRESSKSLKKRRRSLQRGYHSDIDTRENDSWDADASSEEDVVEWPRTTSNKPNRVLRHIRPDRFQQQPPREILNSLQPNSDWAYSEDEWNMGDRRDRYMQPRQKRHPVPYSARHRTNWDLSETEEESDWEDPNSTHQKHLSRAYGTKYRTEQGADQYVLSDGPDDNLRLQRYNTNDSENPFTFRREGAREYPFQRNVRSRRQKLVSGNIPSRGRPEAHLSSFSDDDGLVRNHEEDPSLSARKRSSLRDILTPRPARHVRPIPQLIRRAPTQEGWESDTSSNITVLGERVPPVGYASQWDYQHSAPFQGGPRPGFSGESSNQQVNNAQLLPQNQYNRPRIPRSISDNVPAQSRTSRYGASAWIPYSTSSSPEPPSRNSSNSLSSSGVLGEKTYVYKPLEHKMDFRLVRILPERTYKVKCEIVHATLEAPPEYIAISYAWGDSVDTKRLILGGVTISVSASLYGALKAVREKDREVLVWIDGLSIDQQNKAERASQVKLMGYVYSRARFVAVWLGYDAEDSGLAIPLLEDTVAGRGTTKIKGRVSTQIIQDNACPASKALRGLFHRAFWNRLWVVQEVFLAREVWVYCGQSKLPWQAYRDASDIIWGYEADPQFRHGPSSFPDMSTLVELGPHSLLEVLRACRKKLSENPRDKIFGVLGMLPEDTRKELPVNYDQPVKSLYIDVADHIISSTQRLDVIREAIHYPPHVSTAGLPSWCPDWSHSPEISALREESNFAASGNTAADYEFHDNERKLEFAAIELGTIDAIGVAVGTLLRLQDYLMAFLHWRALLLAVTNVHEEDMDDPLQEIFCRTISLGQVPQEWREVGWRAPCYHVFASLLQECLPRLPIDAGLKKFVNEKVLRRRMRRAFLHDHFGDRMMGRTFCITNTGLMGMGSGFMKERDIVVVPFGCSTPILIRPQGYRGEFRYVGDVYIHGFMHGEALNSGRPVRRYVLH